jgi:predicted transcriptional regulator of viral defense system
MESRAFLGTHPVFTLAEAVAGLTPGNRKGALDRLQYFAKRGLVKQVAHGVYASVPAGVDSSAFTADRYLVAASLRADAVFSHHAALELLGAAHSDWNECSVLTHRRRAPAVVAGVTLRFISYPTMLVRRRKEALGVRDVDRLGRRLRVTGPERTLVDGFWQPNLVGGLAELVESASGFGVLDLDLLNQVLRAYDHKTLWAAVGWFLERYERTFFVSPEYLRDLERHRPRSPHYLDTPRGQGRLAARWNLVLPESLVAGAEPDEF